MTVSLMGVNKLPRAGENQNNARWMTVDDAQNGVVDYLKGTGMATIKARPRPCSSFLLNLLLPSLSLASLSSQTQSTLYFSLSLTTL